MNVFYLDRNPVIAAQMQCDKHVVKMSTEAAQMISTALLLLFPDRVDRNRLFREAYVNHRANVWLRRCARNLVWLTKHGISLCEEYTYRYDKEHKSESVLRYASEFLSSLSTTDLGSAQLPLYSTNLEGKAYISVPLCMPEEYYPPEEFMTENKECTVLPLAVASYRRFYLAEKSSFAKWNKRPERKPNWYSHDS